MDGTVIAEIVVAIIGIGVSIFLSKRYGDKAGTEAAIAYEKQREERERIAALRALLNQVNLIRKIAKSNASHETYITHFTDFVQLPTRAFETAFVSDKPPLSDQHELLEAVNNYLSKAYVVNSSINFIARIEATSISENSQEPQRSFRHVRENCQVLFPILDKLESCLQEAL